MNEKRKARLCDRWKRSLQLLLVDHRKAVASWIDEEAFVAEDTGPGQRQDVLLIVCYSSSPCRPIDEALALRRGALFFQSRDSGCLRQAVERHIDECRITSGCGGAGGGAKALPLSAPRLVDVNMCIDQSGEQSIIATVDYVGMRGKLRSPADGKYLALLHQQ